MMRIDDLEKFQYLLGRGVLASACDNDGFNAIHYAVRMGKIQYLRFLFEGAESYTDTEFGEFNIELTKLNQTLTSMTMNKSYMMHTYS